MYPFGYGLSYTTFDISGVSAEQKGDVVEISAKVTNTGSLEGSETVQVYATEPVKALKGFAKVKLAAGESKTVTISISKTAGCLAIGTSSVDLQTLA